MKNVFKFGFLALAISLSVAACDGKKGGTTDSTTTTVDSSTTTVDTVTKDSAAVDTLVKDTTKKM